MFRAPQGPPIPTAFYGPPTLDQVIQVVNGNTARVQQLQTTSASLSVTGVPSLQCDIAMERPLRFRMTAGTSVTGSELDLGSNDNLFWFWARRNEEPVIYFARHSEFRNAAAAQIMPVPPSWIIDAMGLVQLANDGSTAGPFPQANGRLEVRSRVISPNGELNRSIIIDEQRGHVLEQRVYDPRGQLLAASVTSDHYYEPNVGVTLPRQIDVQLPPAQMAFTIKASGYVLNQLSADGLQLWSMPQKEGYQFVDLARLSPMGLQAAAPTGGLPSFPIPANTWPQPTSSAGPIMPTSHLAPANVTVPTHIVRQQSWRRQFGWW
jgi:hypothetical protein